MSMRRIPMIVVAAIFGLILSAYLYVHERFLQVLPKSSSLSMGGNECAATDAIVKTNPNKMLFISCGGFLD